MNSPHNTYTPTRDVLALMIIVISFAVRYWFVDSGQLNLVQDEAQYWDWIRRPQLSYYSKGPLIAWMIATWTNVFGNTELGVRFGSILGMAGIQAALYIGVSRVWKEYSMAIFVLLVASTMPLLNGLGILATTDNPLIFCWTVAFFALAAATRNAPDRTPSHWPFLILGLCMAVGILAKYMMLTFLALAVIYALILQMRGQMPSRFWGRFFLASLVGTVIGLTPIILWNLHNDWVAYKHVAKLSSGVGREFAFRFMPFLEMLGAQIGLLAPWWFVFILMGSGSALAKSCVGPIGAFDADYRRDLQSVLFFWPLWAIITGKALFSKVEANWTAVAFMAGALLAGMALDTWWHAPRRKTRGRLILSLTAIGLTALIYITPVLPIPDSLNPTHRLKGWNDLGTHIAQLTQTEFDDPEKVFAMSDNYGFTSELAFYIPGQPITYCPWTDSRRMNQYDLWPDPATNGQLGWDAIMVRKRFRSGAVPELKNMFDSVSEPIFYQSRFNGQPARKFTILICKGFNGYWPQNGLGEY
ncbi:phospholipid carrier-dependent glycosyltransferase [Pseudodesulfovibrio sp. JC047]|uniref:ArnT family glycosyltransferase n=1 Tax=Pseudodesulfovibrio sp. JC047 TaxID=2683199 RepID=UPI0013D707B4|nr:glycosyltransferase family 39 protein [Pseudodesulfovibrio sp. JC047]NDV19392.1 phospholipid carrier-dependent glycosyltransferase [Pseudodesulfovibrio sp. JC047]